MMSLAVRAGRLALMLGAGLTALWLSATAAAALVVNAELNEVFDLILQETGQRLPGNLTENAAARLAACAPPRGRSPHLPVRTRSISPTGCSTRRGRHRRASAD